MYNIYYIGSNPTLEAEMPFAQQVDSAKDINSATSMYWLVESDVVVTNYDVFDFVPDRHTAMYGHQWKWNNTDYGGVKLLPKKGSSETVWHDKVVCTKRFQILLSKAPGNYFEDNPTATHVWCVDPEYKLADNIDWAPGNFEPDYIHSFHLRGQLEHKYPDTEGGVKLYPREWNDSKIKYHDYLDATIKYSMMYVDDVNDYAQRDVFGDDYVWLIDKEYKIEEDIDWAPNPFEYKMIHSFKMPQQLQDKYPMAEGGIRLVPDNWRDAELKIHRTCPIQNIKYDVFYINHVDFNEDTYLKCIEQSNTEWLWVIDEDFKYINGEWSYVPNSYEQDYIHVFKIPGHLEYRYPQDAKNPADLRSGGVRLLRNPRVSVPFRNIDFDSYILKQDEVPVQYDIFYTSDMMDYDKYSRKSKTAMYWLVDSEHQISEDFNYVPHSYDNNTIHIFKFPNDLEHKYPRAVTNVSDNRAGGIKLIPKHDLGDSPIPAKYVDQLPVGGKQYPIIYTDQEITVTEDSWIVPTAFQKEITNIPWTPSVFERDVKHVFSEGLLTWMPKEWNTETKVHDFSPVRIKADYQTFATYEEGVANSKFKWFWVVDSDVEVLEDFDFDFQPDVFDDGKAHVWQKLNPITGKQYDYGGVSLRNKSEKKGRPKYMRKPACTQKPFPVYMLQPEQLKDGLNDVYERLANQSDSSMMYIVDPYVDVDFEFDYYPTQYDSDVVHIWAHTGAKNTAVRLLPTDLQYKSEKQILNNEFDRLKEMPTAISKDKLWDRFYFNSRRPLLEQLKEHARTTTHEWFWTVDPDVTSVDLPDYAPEPNNHNKVHAWQRANPTTGAVHSYGGVRLWPRELPDITSDDIKLNSMPRGQMQYVKQIGCTYKELNIVLITYKQDNADELLKRLPERTVLVQDVDGIFEAHQEAAKLCDSDMFWVVDGDAEVVDDFDFSYIPDVYDREVTHVWHSLNPVTGEEYGYGGVKLFNTRQVIEATSWGMDFTTGLSKRFKVIPEVACVTNINTSEYDAWRSAFRECVKLATSTDPDAKQRLGAWLNPKQDVLYSQYAKLGAEMGNDYAGKHKNDITKLQLINDYEWLQQTYHRRVH